MVSHGFGKVAAMRDPFPGRLPPAIETPGDA
jgi:hypothetical protein